MKNVGTQTVEATGNLPEDAKQALGFSKAGMIAIQSILNNMYTNKALAVFREYTANAHDSHVRAGVTEPVRVSLPTPLQPTVEIEDFGVGLSPDEIVPVFGTYGESRSRESDDFVGGFGIGSKSAFTMGQQFIVTARKDGVESVAIFALGEDGGPTATIVSTQPTTERNGVKISLAVEDVYEFHRVANASAKVWKPGTILLDGKAPTSIYEDATRLTDNVFSVKTDNYRAHVYAVMGTVAYPIDDSILATVARNTNHPVAHQVAEWQGNSGYGTTTDLYIELPIGAADIAPSREALRDTKQTVKAIEEAVDSLSTTLVDSVSDSISEAGSLFEAMGNWWKVANSFEGFSLPAGDFTWNGEALTPRAKVEMTDFHLVKKSYRGTAKVIREGDGMTIDYTDMGNRFAATHETPATRYIVVVLDDIETEGPKVKRFSKGFLEKTNYEAVFVTEDATGEFGWFAWGAEEGHGVTTVSLEGWRALLKEQRKQSREANGTPSGPSYALGWSADRYSDRYEMDEIVENNDVVFVADSVVVPYDYRREVVKQAQPIALLPTQKEEIFLKRAEEAGLTVLSADEVEKMVEEIAAEEAAKVTDAERDAISAHRWLSRHHWNVDRIEKWLNTVDGITSKTFTDLADTIALARMDSESITNDRRYELGRLPESLTEGSWDDVDLENINTIWPLLDHVHAWSVNDDAKADLVAYLNSK